MEFDVVVFPNPGCSIQSNHTNQIMLSKQIALWCMLGSSDERLTFHREDPRICPSDCKRSGLVYKHPIADDSLHQWIATNSEWIPPMHHAFVKLDCLSSSSLCSRPWALYSLSLCSYCPDLNFEKSFLLLYSHRFACQAWPGAFDLRLEEPYSEVDSAEAASWVATNPSKPIRTSPPIIRMRGD